MQVHANVCTVLQEVQFKSLSIGPLRIISVGNILATGGTFSTIWKWHSGTLGPLEQQLQVMGNNLLKGAARCHDLHKEQLYMQLYDSP